MSDGTVKAGVIGVGALGRHHARVWAGVEGARLVGVFDTDAGRATGGRVGHLPTPHTDRPNQDSDRLVAVGNLSLAVVQHVVSLVCFAVPHQAGSIEQ